MKNNEALGGESTNWKVVAISLQKTGLLWPFYKEAHQDWTVVLSKLEEIRSPTCDWKNGLEAKEGETYSVGPDSAALRKSASL